MNFNTARITLASFLAYFVMSAIITPLGVVSQPIADVFGVELTTATAVFSSLTTGIFIGSIIAMFVFDWLSIRNVVLLSTALILTSLVAIVAFNNFVAFSILLFFVGVGCGVAMSTAAAVITEVYSERLRPPMLLLTDSFYSGAGTLSSIAGVALLGAGFQWWSVYLVAMAALIFLLVLGLSSTYPEKADVDDYDDSLRSWPPAVYVCGLSLLVYLVGVVTIYSWVPNYTQQTLGIDASEAGNLVGRFFSGMFFGQLAMFVLVLRLPIQALILFCLSGAAFLTTTLWWQTELFAIGSSMFLLGLISGGIFKVLVSYGTTLVANPSPKMVSYLLFNTALGTAIAPALSAWVVAQGSIRSSMGFATLCYALALVLLCVAFVLATRTPVKSTV